MSSMIFETHKQNTKSQSGFTLVEMLVSIGIFSVVMTVSIGTLIVLIQANAKAQALTSSITNVSYAVDAMTRNIRTGYNYKCVENSSSIVDGGNLPTGSGDCLNEDDGGEAIIFNDGENNDRRAYRFNLTTHAVEQKIENGPWLRLTSDEITLSNESKIVVINSTGGDLLQPKVKIFLKGEVIGRDFESSNFQLQTEVTQRILDF